MVSGLNHASHRTSSPTENNNAIEKGKGDAGSNTDKADINPTTGEIIFKDLTIKQLNDFRIITEDGNKPYAPTQNGSYEGDGVYFRNFTDEKYWYKVSGGSSVTISYSNNKYYFSPNTYISCQYI